MFYLLIEQIGRLHGSIRRKEVRGSIPPYIRRWRQQRRR